MCARADDFNVALKQLKEYVGFRQRLEETTYDLENALIAHRAQCLLNLLADEDDAWQHRIELLDSIAEAHGISLEGQDSLREALQALSDRERLRRADEIARHRGVSGPLMSSESMTHGQYHLQRYFAGGPEPEQKEQRDQAELEMAKRPDECDCGFEYADEG